MDAPTIIELILQLGIGGAALKLAWSVDRSQKEMLKVQVQQAQILQELTLRVTELEKKLNE